MVVYEGTRKLKHLVEFVQEEMEKAKKDRVKVNQPSVSATCVKELALKVKIKVFPLCCQEDEDRRKYIEAIKAEEARKAKETKDEL